MEKSVPVFLMKKHINIEVTLTFYEYTEQNNACKMSAKCPQRCLKVPEIKETLLDF